MGLELVAVIIAGVALAISAWVAYATARDRKTFIKQGELDGAIQQRLALVADAQYEAQAQQNIAAVEKEFEEIGIKIAHARPGKDLDVLRATFVSARQRLLNVYDTNCQAYIDDKIDKVRFQKAYERNIYRLFDNLDDFPELRDRNTDYRALVTVYEDWRGPA